MNDEIDVLPKLLEEVKNEFELAYGESEIIRNAFAKLKAKKATYRTANDFAIEIGGILSKALGISISADKLPDGKMYYNIAQRLLTDVLGRNYELVSGYASDVQKNLNDKAKIGLKVQVPELNLDRIAGIVNRFSFEENFEDVSWLLGEPIVNFTQSIIDDSIRENAEFHHQFGLQPEIVRKSYFHCCDWCQEVQGNYKYPRVPKDVYRRHQHCRCIVDYDPKSGKIQNVWTKKISNKSSDELENRKRVNIDVRDNNRKADTQEYKKIVDALGAQNAPISLAKFQDLKYNRGKEYQELKDLARWSQASFPTEKSFNGHFRKHSEEFGNITQAQYLELGRKLLGEPIGDNILGYDTEYRRVRYDLEKNIFALGNNKSGRVTTILKPEEGANYFEQDWKRQLGDNQ